MNAMRRITNQYTRMRLGFPQRNNSICSFRRGVTVHGGPRPTHRIAILPNTNNLLKNISASPSCDQWNYVDLHTTSTMFAKRFVATENTYAYSILRKNEAYSNTLAEEFSVDELEKITDEEFSVLTALNWCNESNENILSGLQKMLSYSCKNSLDISDERFDNITKALVEKISQLNDEDLCRILMYLNIFPPTPSITSHNFVDLWKAIDKECDARMKNWDRRKLFLVADYWYLLSLTSFSSFMWHAIIRISRKPDKLTPSELVQCMFYINARRRFPDRVSIYDFEFSLERCIDKLNIEELSILAMGFFKSKSAIRNQNLMIEIMRRIIDNMDTIHEISLTALLKLIRYSLLPTSYDTLLTLLDKVVPQIDRLSLLSLTHIALVGTNMQLYHEETMNKIVNRISNEIESCRLKDLERIAFALSQYNYEHKEKPSIYDRIAEEICKPQRLSEIERHPKCLPCCLNYLSIKEIYLEDQISKVLSKDFLLTAYGLQTPPPPPIIYTDKVWQYDDLMNRKLSFTDKMLLDVFTTAQAILGDQKVHLGHLIPHRERADVIYGIHDDGSVVNIPTTFRNIDIGVCKKPPDVPGTKWYCLVIGGWNSCIKNTNQPVGSLVAKVRHLQKLQYNPIVIPWYEWRLLSQEKQEGYLYKKIHGELEGKVQRLSRSR
ncbi:hypothetical protein C0J52_22635 [Blattella germanica]|nr:hypothetical protein C0J52_22635 [Blattella germanica]